MSLNHLKRFQKNRCEHCLKYRIVMTGLPLWYQFFLPMTNQTVIEKAQPVAIHLSETIVAKAHWIAASKQSFSSQ